jgi:hypothetical protein
MDADELIKALRAFHPVHKGWIFFSELRLGTSYGGTNEKRVDAWAMQAWPSFGSQKKEKAPHLRRAFEVKVNRSDVTVELRNPDKRWMAYAISHEFWFVAPTGLILPKELDRTDGLMEYDGEALHIRKAPWVRETMPPKWSFVAALARRVEDLERRAA